MPAAVAKVKAPQGRPFGKPFVVAGTLRHLRDSLRGPCSIQGCRWPGRRSGYVLVPENLSQPSRVLFVGRRRRLSAAMKTKLDSNMAYSDGSGTRRQGGIDITAGSDETSAGRKNIHEQVAVQALASSNLFVASEPQSPMNRRISIIVMNREAEARLLNLQPDPGEAGPQEPGSNPSSSKD